MFFNGTIKNGRLTIKRLKDFQSFISKYEGKEITIEVKKKSSKRTDLQNAFYWLCLNVISDDVGHSSEELHNTFKAKFLVDRSGKFPITMSTTSLSTLEFGEYIERIRAFVADYGIELPNSEEYYLSEFSKQSL